MKQVPVHTVRALAARLVEATELDQIYVRASQFRTVNDETVSRLDTDTDIKLSAELDGARIRVEAEYSTKATSTVDGATADMWFASVEVVADYTLTPGFEPTQDELNSFAIVSGMPALHPYARSATQQLTAQSPFPALTLGVLRTLDQFDDDHEIELPEDE